MMYFILFTLFSIEVIGAPTKVCSEVEIAELTDEYALCIAAPIAKYRMNLAREVDVSVCDIFEEFFNLCLDIWGQCAMDKELRDLRENGTHQIIATLSAQGVKVDYGNCSGIFDDFNITRPSEERPVFGECSSSEYFNINKKAWICQNESFATMNKLIASSDDKREEFKRQFCVNLERVINCQSQLKKCITKPEEWVATRRAVIIGAKTAVEELQRTVDFDFPKCQALEADPEPR